MKFCWFLIIIALTACSVQEEEHSEARTPNIVLILADDLGYGDLSCYGNQQIQTPNIDFLQKNGIQFLDFHTNGAVCSPTRAALMSGKYQQKVGIEGVVTAKGHRHTGLARDVTTIADFFKTQDYQTGIVGKWHLGYDTLFSPVNNGFDYFKGYVSGNIDYHSHIDQEGYFDWWENKDTLNELGYSTDLITQSAVDFIAENKEKPFFLYVAHEAPHYPFQGRNDPADRAIKGEFDNWGSREDRDAAYKEMVEIMDEGIGAIIQQLEKDALLENSLIFFLSDNGAMSLGSNGALRGFKGNLWEGGHRVPAIAYWKGKIKADTAHHTLMSMDVFPTFIDLLGVEASTVPDLDGISFRSVLDGNDSNKAMLDRPVFWRFKNQTAIRSGDWKYMKRGEEDFLFNLDEDLGEQNNLIDRETEIKDSLANLLKEWEAEINQYKLETD